MGAKEVEWIFQININLHGPKALEDTVLIDTTLQKKNITYPTDSKLAIKIINRLNKIYSLRGHASVIRVQGKRPQAIRVWQQSINYCVMLQHRAAKKGSTS